MPSVSVPLKSDNVRWAALMKQRRDYWAKPGTTELTDHFRSQEFWCNDGSPAPIVSRPALIRLCEVFLEPMRTKFGVCLILSGYRHVLYNAMIGGARHSQHVYEDGFESVAADIRFGKGTPAQWAAYARGLRTQKNQGQRRGRTLRPARLHPCRQQVVQSGLVGMSVNVTAAVTDLCKQMNLKPRDIGRLELTPRGVTAFVYKRNALGDKYLGDDGEPAVERRHYEADWSG